MHLWLKTLREDCFGSIMAVKRVILSDVPILQDATSASSGRLTLGTKNRQAGEEHAKALKKIVQIME